MLTALLSPVVKVGRFGIFAGKLALRLLRGPWYLRRTIEHLAWTFSRCVWVVAAVVMALGMVIALQGLEVFDLFGAHRLLAALVSASVLRELSPVLASVLVAAQGGSAVAAQLASMNSREELDATAVMGVDPMALHVLPRAAGLALAAPLLHLVGVIAGITGGLVTAVVFRHEQAGVLVNELWAFTAPIDIVSGLVKSTVFGIIIGALAAWHGTHARPDAVGVGRAVNDTVVHTVTAFIVANYFLSTAFFGAVS
ncbi:MAG: ABC transporter permease [Myxococcota bacterium]|nr:ABC transporter permease [Myxococcota bacterium]